MVDAKPIHHSDWAQQPQVRIECDQSYVSPAWNARGGVTDVPNVYEAADGRLYAFEDSLLTCSACRASMEAREAGK